MMHPVDEIWCSTSKELDGRLIIMGITGSIAAVESFRLARELIRHGADVIPVMTEAGCDLVTPMSMEYATGNVPITEITGATEHVALLGDHDERADMLLIYPATANTLSKMATGICDNAVAAMGSIALGGDVPIVIAPAMHLSMLLNPAVQRSIMELDEMGAVMLEPRVEEGKAKVASVEEVVETVIREMGDMSMDGRHVLVIGGATEEPIDAMRTISNRSSGATAVELAKAAYRAGADVELWMARTTAAMPSYILTRRFSSVSDLIAMLDDVDHDTVLVPAALSDYAPGPRKGKFSSDEGSLTIDLEPVPKVLPLLRGRTEVLVGFKAESGVDRDDLVSRATARLESYSLDAIVANDLGDVTDETSSVVVVTRDAEVALSGTKRAIADGIIELVSSL